MGGSFARQAMFGVFFMQYAMHWCFFQWRKYFIAHYKLRKHMENVRSSSSKIREKLVNFPWQAAVKIYVGAFGYFFEFLTDDWKGSYFTVHGENMHYMATYFLYGTSGVVDIAQHYNKCIPKQAGTIAILLVLAHQAIGLRFNLKDRYEFDTMVHTLLLYIIIYCAFTLCLELRYPKSLFISLGRAFGFALQGSWMLHIGLTLFPPISGMPRWLPGDPNTFLYDKVNDELMRKLSNSTVNATEDAYMTLRIKQMIHDDIMIATNICAIHMLAIVVLICTLGGFMNQHYKRIVPDIGYRKDESDFLLSDDNALDR